MGDDIAERLNDLIDRVTTLEGRVDAIDRERMVAKENIYKLLEAMKKLRETAGI